MKKSAQPTPAASFDRDPWPYDGPIERADGQRPYNRYLWPMGGDWFWANREFGHSVSSRFNFSVVGLADGRWSTSGHVGSIEKGREYEWQPGGGQPVVYPTREAALRVSAARFIRMCRSARKWRYPDGLTQARYQQLATWALGIVKRPAPAFREIEPTAAPRSRTGLPLFDVGLP